MNAGVEQRQRAAYLRDMVPATAGYAAGWIVYGAGMATWALVAWIQGRHR